MPILEILYNTPKRTSNQIYMLLIILLILSQDSTFNASVHKLVTIPVLAPLCPTFLLAVLSSWLYVLYLPAVLTFNVCFFSFPLSVYWLVKMLPSVLWYKERRLNHTSLGSLMVVVLIRTVKYNLCRLQVHIHSCFNFLYLLIEALAQCTILY